MTLVDRQPPLVGRPEAPTIVLDDVRKSYGDRHAVDGVSLTVRRGEFFGIIGPNGAGKTTLIEVIEGLRRADSGSISVLGESPWPRNVRLLPKMGVQTQKAAFFARLSCREHLDVVAALYRAQHERIHATLDMVGLVEQADVRVDKLSGGQRQRLAIASALVHEPTLVFLDEATAALDPQARRDLWTVLRQLKGRGSTIVYTTHHLDEAEALCDRVAVMSEGRFVAVDSPNELMRTSGVPSRVLVPVGRVDLTALRTVAGASDVSVEGGSVVIQTHHTATVLSAVDKLCGLEGVQTRTASLEDVYLDLISQRERS